nr:hypothetical protein [Candidatus Sigynarchaeota archaeon]
MAKKFDELPIACSVVAPRNKGTININVGSCLSCEQPDPAKISVLNESREIIKYSSGPPEGEEGDVYELECDVCHFKYKLAVLRYKHPGENSGGPWEFCSLYGADERTKNKWMWIGYF